MDFFQIIQQTTKRGNISLTPDFKVCHSKDLMVRGKDFYAIWDEEKGLWSTDEYDVPRLIDNELRECKDVLEKNTNDRVHVNYLSNFSTGSWTAFKLYLSKSSNNFHPLDNKIIFANTPITKKDYASRRLPYALEKGSTESWDELLSTLYSPEEAEKIEWAIGAIISGESKNIQKFLVFYGAPGTGKSTILNIVQKLFEGYYIVFEAKELTLNSSGFSTEVFKSNPLLGIQHDGDLSRIEDNTRLNSIVSHEEIIINEKYKSGYTIKSNCFLMLGTNKPVKITDAKSGIIRRLIDVRPTGNKLPPSVYQALIEKIDFELGGIAYKCLETFNRLGKNYYNTYVPRGMMFETDVFYNFIEDNAETLKDGITLKRAYAIYKDYCEETLISFKMPMYKFREELKVYYKDFYEMTRVDGKQVRSYYSGFRVNEDAVDGEVPGLVLDATESVFDSEYPDLKAQYASEKETPIKKWDEVTTKLSDLDTTKLHYVMLPLNHIVIDFDLKDEEGNKSLERNLLEASKWPRTYAELSKGGCGIHLHYIYNGDVSKLSHIYSEGIEIKTFTGNSSLRRRLSKCNKISIAAINSGLPLKGESKVINFDATTKEKTIRTMILKNLAKEYHGATKPSVDYIYKILNDAYNSGMCYDVTDLRQKILTFAINSTNHSDYCVSLVQKMKFKSENNSDYVEPVVKDYDGLVFFDCEVFPNLLLVNWKYEGKDKKCVHMFNPSPAEVEELFKFKLVGFNCRKYDNHILYARYMGYSEEEIFKLSQRLVSDDKDNKNAFFSEAYNISYTDILDFVSKKKSLKKYEIELGIHHQELGLAWDKPVPKEKWNLVAEYCDNDVIASEAVFHARKADWIARVILSKLSGLSTNDTTQQHVAKIIFGNDPHPQSQFVYTDLSKEFPGYKFENGKSSYKGEDPGEGGEVYAEPGMYSDVALLDIASMHPTSTEQLNLFGDVYTKRFSDIKSARIAVKHKDRESLKSLLGGVILPFYDEACGDNADFTLADLAYALKIAINIVYGLTSAKFPNKFKDPRNIDNIVAKRGALFMINLRHEVQARGFKVAHIKTDSIKIPNATPEIIQFVMDYGKKYGYNFEHEATYKKLCLVNDAVYIAKEEDGHWTATGAQFAQPYVFKTLFSHEPIEFDDKCETRNVKTALYLDMNEGLSEDEHNYQFVGKTGLFCPIKSGCGGGLLMRSKDDKYISAPNSKGYRWLESEMVKDSGKEDDIDMSFYTNMVNEAVESISKYGDFEWFVAD